MFVSGVGYSVVLVAFYTDWFYNMIIAWSLYYFGISFNTKLPWMFCGNEWNTPNCTDTHLSMNVAQFNWSAASVTSRGNVTFPVEEFFKFVVQILYHTERLKHELTGGKYKFTDN